MSKKTGHSEDSSPLATRSPVFTTKSGTPCFIIAWMTRRCTSWRGRGSPKTTITCFSLVIAQRGKKRGLPQQVLFNVEEDRPQRGFVPVGHEVESSLWPGTN